MPVLGFEAVFVVYARPALGAVCASLFSVSLEMCEKWVTGRTPLRPEGK